MNDASIDATLRTCFVIAGSYTLTATFKDKEADPESVWHVNNYIINDNSDVKSVVMDKYTITLQWLYGCGEHEDEVYDINNPCVYDKTEHSVKAKGFGILDENDVRREMELVTAGTFSAIAANSSQTLSHYRASVERIADGFDTISITLKDASVMTAEVSYATNYKLPADTYFDWTIKQRPITLTFDVENSYMSKIYDNTNTFDVNSASREENSVVDDNQVVVKTITYLFQETDYDIDTQNKIVYSLHNIISGDEDSLDVRITEAITDMVNVNALIVNLSTGGLEGNKVNNIVYNYCIEQDITGLRYSQTETEKVIVPRRVKASFKEGLSHVYNGFTFESIIGENVNIVADLGIVDIIDVKTGEAVTKLYDTNYFRGSFSLGGATNAGYYAFTTQFDIVDVNGVHNYDFVDKDEITVIDSTTDNVLSVQTDEEGNDYDYVIEERSIKVVYQYQLQSFNQTLKNVEGYVVLEESDLTDMEWGIDGEDNEIARQNALKELLVEDGFVTEDGRTLKGVENRWKEGTYSEYTYIVGNQTTADNGEYLLEFAKDESNYAFSAPTLQLTYLKVEDDQRYEFGVYSFQDLIEMEKDVNGLANTRIEDGIGVAPTYVQKNNLSGIREEGGYNAIARTNMEFDGTYNGNGYSISDFIIYCSGVNNFGLFGVLSGATIQDLDVRRVNMVGGSSATYIGVIAGMASDSVISGVNVSANVTITNLSNDIYVGGLVGYANNVTFTQNGVTGYVIANGATAYFGGVAGVLEVNGDATPTVEDNIVFVDAKVKANEVYADYIVGTTTATITENVYLENSLLIIDSDNNNLASIKPSTVQGQGTGYTYYDYVSEVATNGSDNVVGKVLQIVNTDMMRNFIHLPGATIPNSGVIEISYYRQLSLISAYGWLNYKLTNDVYIPGSLVTGTQEEHFYGTFTKEDHVNIYAVTDATYNLMLIVAGEQQQIVVQQGA